MPPVVALALAAGAAGLAAALPAGIVLFGTTTLTGLLVNLAISFALMGILGLVMGANAQRPAAQKQNFKQAIAPRVRAYARQGLGQAYRFWFRK